MHVVSPPKKRSQWRRALGKKYYTWRRNIKWLLRRRSFSKTQSADFLPALVKAHRSFLLRPLRNVDMYLQHNKVVNLRLAVASMNGILIKPGETFSIWYLVGKPSEKRGYKPGLVLNQGNIETGIGGGLCQLGNLIFWMALHSPLRVTERYRHGYDVFPDINRSIPFACGATLSYNYVDLQLKNETSQTFQIRLWLSEDYLHGEIRCQNEPDEYFEVYESHHQIIHQSWGGYTRHNQIKRRTIDKTSGEVLEDVVILENQAIMMYAPLLPA
jgi:vancomycin resistance protein VanW